MDIDKKLELLKKIQPVEAPPFLLTRIRASIDLPTGEKLSATWRFAFVAVALIVLTLNVSAFFTLSNNKSSKGIEEVVNSMELSNSNDLYHE
jgi:hypothetical protein